jgi:hypothetical protein
MWRQWCATHRQTTNNTRVTVTGDWGLLLVNKMRSLKFEFRETNECYGPRLIWGLLQNRGFHGTTMLARSGENVQNAILPHQKYHVDFRPRKLKYVHVVYMQGPAF